MYLDPKNLPKIPPQQVFGCLGLGKSNFRPIERIWLYISAIFSNPARETTARQQWLHNICSCHLESMRDEANVACKNGWFWKTMSRFFFETAPIFKGQYYYFFLGGIT